MHHDIRYSAHYQPMTLLLDLLLSKTTGVDSNIWVSNFIIIQLLSNVDDTMDQYHPSIALIEPNC